ncbi:MAG: hypothetical protein WC376_00985 [Candidatus Nanoarchaeia archaeon]|jgi:hypothetical protein
MNISKLDKAEVLAALYNASKPQGMGFIQFNPNPMSVNEARQYIETGITYFDYLKGRVMKIDLSSDELLTGLYNRDNGENAAEKVLMPLIKSKAITVEFLDDKLE